MEFKLFAEGKLVTSVIFGTIIFYYLYYYLSHSRTLEKIIYDEEHPSDNPFKIFIIRKFIGFGVLGLLPVVIWIGIFKKPFALFGLQIQAFISSWHIILSLVVIIVGLLYITHRINPEKNSLQVPLKEWTGREFAINCLGWIAYLIGYEFLFRGILLSACYMSFGFWPAIAVNVAIYSAIHMVNGKDQAIGAILFGTIACFFTLTKGTILIPIFMHIALSLTSDYLSIRMNPEHRFVKPSIPPEE